MIDRHRFPDERVTSVVGDLCDPAVVGDALGQATDVVIHLAAVTSVLRSMEDPAGTYKLNVDATFNLLETAKHRGVQTFLLASTNAVTGDVGTATITEQVPLRPLTPYGATKAAGEMLLSAYVGSYGIRGAALRFANVYGQGMEAKDSFVPRLMRAARDGKGVQIYGDGTQLRDLVHVDDIVAGIFTAWRSGHNGPLILGSGESVTVNDILDAARAVTGAEIPARVRPRQAGRNARGRHRHLGGQGAGVRAANGSEGRYRHCVARVLGECQVTSSQGGANQGSKGNTAMRTPAEDEAIDVAAIEAFTNQYGARATSFPRSPS